MAARRKELKKIPQDSEGHPLLTRSNVAQMLGRHVSTVRKLEKQGVLRPVFITGVHYFSREAVAEVLKRRPEAVSSPAFALFEAGKLPVEVVIELGADPDHVEALWKSYQRLLGNWVVEGPGSLKAWEPVYKLGELTPNKLRRALEIVCADPKLRAVLERG